MFALTFVQVVQAGPSPPAETRLIKALDWLSFDEATHTDYLTQSNAVLRLFLAGGRLQPARTLLVGLAPDALAADGATADDRTQHLSWHALFDALDAHERFLEVWAARGAETSVFFSPALRLLIRSAEQPRARKRHSGRRPCG